ncbi:MAG: zinc ribbon domain-containing protein [Vibrio hibernica]|uniref:zinc ribbon domain-containing protein n=1 Tax=Vibrio hibernica TaxID=2587465 RepID=UPI0039B0BED2
MPDYDCPNCDTILVWQRKNDKNQPVYGCNHCHVNFTQQAFCPACDHELNYLQACGSSSFFCPQCNELKSKSTVVTKLQPIKDH